MDTNVVTITLAKEKLPELNRTCQHTLYHVDHRGILQGTWQATQVEKWLRVDCCICGKFYAYQKRGTA